ncbi:peptide-methionine (S)-S-oxide reductase MsrA [Luteimonas vadosa]|uniref:Peptide methionine sulfoxide reductase MsrA n=2 Tax=Luteimonas vadosa TaxID=1165507 RepID=A0ABP9DQM8_9GAMM
MIANPSTLSLRRAAAPAATALLMLAAMTACAQQPPPAQPAVREAAPRTVAVAQDTRPEPNPAQPAAAKSGEGVAIFAGGCFWCMEPPFDKLPGVISTTSGYTGGHTENPTYEQTTAGNTGHTEAVQVRYDPTKVDYQTLLDVFWRNIDPFAVDRQFCDAGSQYRSGIFPMDAGQRRLAEASKQKVAQRFEGQAIATEITDATAFWPAEKYHQDYYLKNPVRYKFYRFNCGRDARLDQIWGKQG